ncbi:MAG: hypothetical protein OXI87_24495 [Albidovulum sp.]|nr:hypothetical protein [Albidovulum sp.]MDE0533280.1 hypothetical protein [Albidovulum sp.]
MSALAFSSRRPIYRISTPTEQAYGKFRHLLRDAVERTAEENRQRIGVLLDKVPRIECASKFRNLGYASE